MRSAASGMIGRFYLADESSRHLQCLAIVGKSQSLDVRVSGNALGLGRRGDFFYAHTG